MGVPFKSLDAVTATGAGATHDNESVKVDHSLKVNTTGGPGDYPVRYLRANLSVLTGGSSPTVTAWIASA